MKENPTTDYNWDMMAVQAVCDLTKPFMRKDIVGDTRAIGKMVCTRRTSVRLEFEF